MGRGANQVVFSLAFETLPRVIDEATGNAKGCEVLHKRGIKAFNDDDAIDAKASNVGSRLFERNLDVLANVLDKVVVVIKAIGLNRIDERNEETHVPEYFPRKQ